MRLLGRFLWIGLFVPVFVRHTTGYSEYMFNRNNDNDNVLLYDAAKPILGNVFPNLYKTTKNVGAKLPRAVKNTVPRMSKVPIVPMLPKKTQSKKTKEPVIRMYDMSVTDARYKKHFVTSKLARGGATSKRCNSRCSAKIECNKRCQQAKDRYQLDLAKRRYKKEHVTKYTSPTRNQRFYRGEVEKGRCNRRCQEAKLRYERQRIQYMKTFHELCQNGHIKNTGTYHGKPLSDQGNPSGDTLGDKTTIGGYGGTAKGRPLGRSGAGQINWPNSAKYNWRADCRSYSAIIGSTQPPSKKV